MSLFNTKLNPHMLSLLDNDDETYYEGLSPEKRLELDNLQARAILHHLRRFTLASEHTYFIAVNYRTICNYSSSPRRCRLTFVCFSFNQYIKLIVIEKGEYDEEAN